MKQLLILTILAAVLGISACNKCNSPVDTTDTSTSSNAELFYNYALNKSTISLFRCNADGSAQRAFSTTGGYLTTKGFITCSPRNGKICFCEPGVANGSQDPYYNLIIANVSGSGATLLCKGDSTRNIWFSVLSPDASRIVFNAISHNPFSEELHIINADGSNERTIATDIQYESQAVFSPDGQRLAYYTRNKQIAIISLDGSNKTIIAENAYGDNDYSSFLDWSPDGLEIVFMSNSAADSRYADVSIVNVATHQVRTIVSSTSMTSGQPAWSPDGKSIAYIQGYYDLEFSAIHTCNPDGSNVKTLFNQHGYYGFYPRWSPDSKKLSATITDDPDMFPDKNMVSVRIFDVASANSILLGNNLNLAFWVR